MSRRKRSRRRPPEPSFPYPFPTDSPGRPWFGLYAGSDTAGAPWWCGPEQSMLVLGPPRSGKTTSVVVPCVLDAPAAVVSTSTKTDVLAATCFWRWMVGNCYLFDPSGETVVPPGVVPLRWSPVTGCESFERAVAMAHSLASAGRLRAALSEAAHWVERAEALLAPLLFAAALRGRDMATVCRWVLARDLREPDAVISRSGHEIARAVLAGVASTEDRERSGIFSTASGILAAYRSEAALRSAADPNFFPEEFVRSTDALYICAPAHAQDQLAPLIVALLDQIRTATYARPRNASPVVFALDEVAGIAPLPSLPALAAEGGGQGLVTLACLQDLSQARGRWGEAAAGFFSIFNHKLIFCGIGDHRTLQLISALAGERELPVRSITWSMNYQLLFPRAVPSVTESVVFRPRISVDQIGRAWPRWALSIGGPQISWVCTPPWWEHRLWSTYFGPRTAPVFSQDVRPVGSASPAPLPAGS